MFGYFDSKNVKLVFWHPKIGQKPGEISPTQIPADWLPATFDKEIV